MLKRFIAHIAAAVISIAQINNAFGVEFNPEFIYSQTKQNLTFFPRSPAPSSSTCIKGNAIDSGCAGANGTVSFNVLTDTNYGPGTGQTFVTQPPWNIAGNTADGYAVGVQQGVTLQDPATYNWAGTGCSYNPYGAKWGTMTASISGTTLTTTATSGLLVGGSVELVAAGGVAANTFIVSQIDATNWVVSVSQTVSSRGMTAFGGPKVSCTSGTSLTITGIDFGPIGGHDCTLLTIGNTYNVSIDIENNHFKGCFNATTAGALSDHTLFVGDNGTTGTPGTITFNHNTVDGDCTNPYCAFSDYDWQMMRTGLITMKWNAIINMPNRPLTAGCSNTCGPNLDGYLLAYNLFVGMSVACSIPYPGNCNSQNTHGEMIEYITSRTSQPLIALEEYDYNTCVIPNWNAAALVTACIFISGGAADGVPPTQTAVVHGNTIMNNVDADCTSLGGPRNSCVVATDTIYLEDRQYQSLTVTDNYIDIGTLPSNKTVLLYRYFCGGTQTKITGATIDASGVLTVPALAPNPSAILSLTPTPGYGNKQLWWGGIQQGAITSQLSGTTGGVGTYQTSGVAGLPLTTPTDMVAFLGGGDAVVFSLSTMSGNIDLDTGLSLNTWDGLSNCSVPIQ
jgi:hypothetical protein